MQGVTLIFAGGYITAVSKLEQIFQIDILMNAGKPKTTAILICTRCCKILKY